MWLSDLHSPNIGEILGSPYLVPQKGERDNIFLLCMVAHAFHSSTPMVEASDLCECKAILVCLYELQAGQGSIVSPCLKKKKKVSYLEKPEQNT